MLKQISTTLLEKRWITGTLALSLLAISLTLAWQWERRQTETQMRQVTAQARILAGSLSGAMAFDDVHTVQEYLTTLKLNRSVQAVGVYATDGRLVAGYTRNGERLPRSATSDSRQTAKGELAIAVPVNEGGLSLGQVYLRSSIEPLSARLSRYVAIGIVIVLASLLIVILGASNAAAAAANRLLQEQVAAREQAEAALRQAQKMEALGQLTGGVAHDFNNLLMAASSGLDLLEKAKSDERRVRLRQAIRDALQRGARITEQLLAFSRRRPLQVEVVQLDRHMGSLAQLLDHSLREDISVKFAIPSDIWPVEIDLAQFDTAILNLAVNARDAMPKGGSLCISARNIDSGLEQGDAVEVSVKDDGEGMAPELLERVFEPFFTTKEAGKGTGLGLSQVYGFAHAAGGSVRIESQLGEGSEISLILPRCLAGLPPSDPAKGAPGQTRINGANILLVEDDIQLNELIGDMLEEHGASLLRAHTGEEALRLAAERVPDIVLSDMIMPGPVDGFELARTLRVRDSALPIVLMTGFSDQSSAAAAEGFPLLRKPFRLPALVDCLEQALRSREGFGEP